LLLYTPPLVLTCFARTEKKEKPTLTPMTDVECAEQEEVRFETTVAGKPQPTVEWYELLPLSQCKFCAKSLLQHFCKCFVLRATLV